MTVHAAPALVTITHDHLRAEEGQLPLTIARGQGQGAAVVIAPSAFGIGADLEAQMSELAVSASVVVAMDPFFRGDAGFIAYDEAPRRAHRPRRCGDRRARGCDPRL